MGNFDPRYAKLHKRIYEQFLDELDKEILKEIIENPSGDEAQLLNQRVDAEIRRVLSLGLTQN